MNLRVSELRAVAEPLQIIDYTIDHAPGGEIYEADLLLSKMMAEECESQGGRRLMNAITAALERGDHGVSAARRTINRVFEIAFEYAPGYCSARRLYLSKLTEIRRQQGD